MILETYDLTKTYKRQQREFDAVSHVNFSIDAGELAVLTGPSGCGKSTFFHLLCGFTRPTSGEVRFDGHNLCAFSRKQSATLRASKISYILQGDSLLSNLNIIENICIPHRLCGCKADLEKVGMKLLRDFDMEDLSEEYPANLSGGERRRVAIIRAFVHEPELIIADEPTSDLDDENTKIIFRFFEQQCKTGKAILLSTHHLSRIPSGYTHYVMSNGVIQLD